jgi:hypothetical protein
MASLKRPEARARSVIALRDDDDPWRDWPPPPGHIEAAAAVAAKIAAGEHLPGTKAKWKAYYASLATGLKERKKP